MGEAGHHVHHGHVVARGGTENESAAVGQFGHHVAAVAGLQVDENIRHVFLLQTVGHGFSHLGSAVPHAFVGNDGALLGFLLGKGQIGVDDELHVFGSTEDEAVIGGDYIELQTEISHSLQGFEHLGRVGQYDVVVVALHGFIKRSAVTLVGKAVGTCNVLTEGIVAEKHLVFFEIGHHAVGPVQHTGFEEGDVALADVQAVAVLDDFDGPSFGIINIGHGLVAHGRAEDLFGLAQLNDAGKGTGMILLKMVAHDVVDAFRIDDFGDVLHQSFELVGVHGIEEHLFLVAYEIGVIGAALGGAAVVVEVADVEIYGTDPVNVLFQFNRSHVFPRLGKTKKAGSPP